MGRVSPLVCRGTGTSSAFLRTYFQVADVQPFSAHTFRLLTFSQPLCTLPQKMFEMVHLFLDQPVWDENAMERAKQTHMSMSR